MKHKNDVSSIVGSPSCKKLKYTYVLCIWYFERKSEIALNDKVHYHSLKQYVYLKSTFFFEKQAVLYSSY